jgi:hypothetical protein
MKIGISGAQSVGKTTVLDNIKEYYPSHTIISGVIRGLAEDFGISAFSDLGNDVQKGVCFQMACLEGLIQREDMASHFISDRTVFDTWAYWQKWHVYNATSTQREEYLQKIRVRADSYDIVFYIAPEFDPVADGVRSTAIPYQFEIARTIHDAIFRFRSPDLPVYQLTGSVDERVAQFLSVVGGYHEK